MARSFLPDLGSMRRANSKPRRQRCKVEVVFCFKAAFAQSVLLGMMERAKADAPSIAWL